jgi:hypothetical protein
MLMKTRKLRVLKTASTWWRIITRQQTPIEKARRAIRGARRQSEWLGKRPFSDKYGYDGSAESSRFVGYDDKT